MNPSATFPTPADAATPAPVPVSVDAAAIAAASPPSPATIGEAVLLTGVERSRSPEPLLRFSWATTNAELVGLRDLWTSLDDGEGPGGVFRSWEWQATWWRHLGDRPGRALRILVASDEVGPRAILPLYVESAPLLRLVPRRRIRFLADGVVGSDYLGLIAPAHEQALLAPRVAAHLVRAGLLDHDDHADLLELTDLLDGDPFAVALGAALGGAAWDAVRAEPRYRCPYACLANHDLESFLASLPNGHGSQLRKRTARLAREPGFALEVRDDPAGVVSGLEDLFTVHRLRWAQEGGSDAFTDERVEAFHRTSARLLAQRGFARLAVLRLGDRPVAAGYGFARGRRFAYYQAGIDPAWKRLSAGTVVLGALVERAFAEGLEEIDFLRGEEPYKKIWADAARTTHALRARAPTLSARTVAAAEHGVRALRRRVRRALPDPVVRQLRRVLGPL